MSKKTTKKNRVIEPGQPTSRFIPNHEFAPDDMPGKQGGAYKHLARAAAAMGVEYRLTGKTPPTKEQFFRELQFRSGMADVFRGRK